MIHGFWKTKQMEDGSFYIVRCRWKPIVIIVQFLMGIAALASLVVALFVFSGCQRAPRQTIPNPSLVLHITETLNDPKVSWEYSRNDEHLNVVEWNELRRRAERYREHQSLIIRSVDRQSIVGNRPRDYYQYETRTETKN